MNRIYSLVWNRALRVVQVASEIARTRGGGGAGGAVRAGLPKSLALAIAVALATQVTPAAFAATGTTRSAALSGAGGVMQPVCVILLGAPAGGGVHTDCGAGGGGGGGTSATYGAGGGGGYGGGGYNSATKTWDTSGNGAAGTSGSNGSSGTGGAAGAGGVFNSNNNIGVAGNAGNAGSGTGGGSGGGGGSAGYVAQVTPINATADISGNWSGGAGGAGGAAGNTANGYGGGGGEGGAGVLMTSGDVLGVLGGTRVTGGAGGAAGAGKGASAGSGGAGVVMLGNAALTVASATIAGGKSGDSTPIQADAVELAGGGNTLTLEVGSAVTGNIVSTSGSTNGDTLILGDDTLGTNPAAGGSDSLAINTVSGFSNYYKTGTSRWTLTGTNADVSPWDVQGGTLIVGSATTTASLAGPVTVENGATLGGYGSVGTAGATPTTTTVKSGGILAPGSSTSFNTAGTFGTFTVNGNLVLSSGSVVRLNLGAPSATVGAFGSGDNIKVNGGLTLGGATGSATLNVANVGSMGPGLYNVINYTGALTNTGGLTVATTAPTGQKFSVQYTAGQVNLLNASTGPFVVWAPGTLPALGGDGTWNLTLNRWTDASTPPDPQQAWTQSGFAEFQGTAGIVTVDSSGGAINATGMQFFVDKYQLVGTTSGDAVTLIGTTSGGVTTAPIINVGDGKATSASYKATISAVLAGTDGLNKTDYGTLILAGANTYTGGTTISGGTLQVGDGGTSGSINGDVTDNSALAFDRSDAVTFAGAISGNGSLAQQGMGTGTLTINGVNNTFSGGTTVDGGTLEVASGGTLGTGWVTVNGGAGMNSTLQVDSGATLANRVVLSSSATSMGDCTTSNACATLTNAGTLNDAVDAAVVAGSGFAIVNNTGAITGSGNIASTGNAYGVNLAAGGSVTNSGAGSRISSMPATGYGTGVAIGGAAGTVTNNNGATITASSNGVVLLNGGSVVNDGTDSAISSSGNGSGGVVIAGATGWVTNSDGAIISGEGAGVALASGGTVTNTGTGSSIQGTSSTGSGMTVGNTGTGVQMSGANSTVINTDGATISGFGQGVLLLNAGVVTNGSGSTISATGGASGDCNTTGDCGILVYTGAPVGGLTGLGGALTLNNAGSIIGNVQMDPNSTNFTTLTAGGSIAGNLDIGIGTAPSMLSTLTLNGDAGTSQLYSQAVTGTTAFDGALIKDGAGEWIIDSADLFPVTSTTINTGTLQIGNGLAGPANGVTYIGAITDNGALIFDLSDTQLAVAGAISGNGRLTQQGTGSVITLNSTSGTFAGSTELADGTLIVGGDAASNGAALGGSAVVDSGATLGGFGTVGGSGTTVEVKQGGILSPGAGSGSTGMLTVGGNLTLDQGSVLDYDLGAPGAPNPLAVTGAGDNVNVGGTLFFNGGSTLNLAGVGGPGLYNLASYGSLAMTGCSFSGGTACMTLGSVPTGVLASSYSIVNVQTTGQANGQIDLYNTGGQTLDIWAPPGSSGPAWGGTGNWTASSATWTDPNGVGPGRMAQPGLAIFQGAPGTVTVSGDVSVTGMQFAVNGYTLQSDAVNGGSVALLSDSAGNAPVIEVGDNSSNSANMTATISSGLQGSDGFSKTGAGTLVLDANESMTGTVAVQGGILQVGNGNAPSQGSFDVPTVALMDSVSMDSGTRLVLNDGMVLNLSLGAATGAAQAAVSGDGFDVSTSTSSDGVSAIVSAGFSGTPGNVTGSAQMSAIQGTGFTATFGGNTFVLASGAAVPLFGAGSAAITGSDFNIVNNSNLGVFTVPASIASMGLVPGGVVPYGISGGAGLYSLTGAAGMGGAGITGTGFTVTNSGGVYGGAGGLTQTGTAGAGGAGISGSGFTVTNTGKITGGKGGSVQGVGAYAAVGGAGGVGVSSSGGSSMTNSGSITGGAAVMNGGGAPAAGGAGIVAAAGDSIANTGSITGGEGGYGQSRPAAGGVGIDATGRVSIVTSGSIAGGACGGFNGCGGLGPDFAVPAADAVDMSNGGNSLTLESGFSFTGNVVSSSGTGASAVGGGDTLALGGDTDDTFDVSNIVDALPAGATATQYVGINQFAKTGSSTWVLTGTTASVTPWTLDDGTLSVASDANLGAAAGPLTFNGGTLENTAAFSTARNVALDSTGAFQTDADLTVSGVISGPGSIAKTGSATLTLPGANTFTGGTNVDAGAVDVGNNTSLGSGAVAMAAGTTLGFAANGLDLANGFALSGDPAFNIATASQTDTISGVIADGSAPGVLEKTGDGALILLGANTYSGGTTIGAGTLQIGNGGTSGALGTGAIVDNGTLVFDRSDAVALPAGLTGTGNLVQRGSGTFTVNGDDSGFAGTTTIKAGTATVGDDSHASASLGGIVTIAKSATLTGIGTIGGMDLSGALSPGNSVGTFHVTGDATFETGSTFNVEANADGTADQLAVGGKTTIKGGNTVVLSQPGNWAPRTTYTIITSGGGVSGQFAGVSDDQAFLTPTLAYGAKDVSLTLARNDINFATVAATPNQKGAATGIEGTGFGNPLYDAVVKLNAADAQAAFNQTSGEYHASQQTARVEDSRYIREAMNQRLRNGDNDPEADKVGNLTAWAHGWGHWGTVDSDGNAAKLSDNGDGLLIGADMPVGAARVGVTGGASRNSLSVNDRNSWGRETSTWLGAFASIDMSAFSLRGGLAYAWDRIPTNREINFPGYTDRLSGNASGDTLTGFIEGAWTFKFGQSEITPFLNVAHTKVETDASTEAGGAAALHAFDSTTNVSFSTLGARGAIHFAHNLNLHGELGWQHAFGDTTPEANLQFVAGGPAFTEYGVPIAKNAGLGRIGIGWHQGNIAVDADYEGLAGNGVKDQAAKVSVSITF